MDNAELIKGLRHCGEDVVADCNDCPLFGECDSLEYPLLHAADALEVDDKRIATYQSDVADLEQREKELNDVLNERARLITELQARIADLEAEMKRMDKEFEKMASDATDYEADLYERIAELEAQLPKDGEWIWENYYWHCSVCGENPTRGIGYVQGKSELFRVCPNCGARMMQ